MRVSVASFLCSYAFFEYRDPNVTDTAVLGLNNLKIGDKTLTVRRSQPKAPEPGGMGMPMHAGMMGGMDGAIGGLTPAQLGALASLRAQSAMGQMPPVLGGGAPQMQVPQMGMGAPGGAARAPSSPTRVLVMLQMVVADILRDDTEYREIYEDIEQECRRYGEVRSVVIPRPTPDNAPVNGLGKVFVEFATPEQAIKARAEVEGRQFDGRTVLCDFWPDDKWARQELD